jgi:phosphopentomutase
MIISLKDKIFKLIVLVNEEKTKNNVLLKNKEELELQLKEKKLLIQQVEQKYENLKLGKIIDISGSEIHDAQIKINRIVREVDNCIALLNK